MKTGRQGTTRHGFRFIVYLVVALSFGVVVTLVLDSYENIATERGIRLEEETEVRNAAQAFKESAPFATSDEVMGFVKKFVSTGMKNKLIAIDPEKGPIPNPEEFRFLMSLTEGRRRLDIFIRSAFLKDELASLDLPEIVFGVFATIAVFAFMVLYSEKRRQTLAMKADFETKHAELTRALEEHEALALLGRMAATLAHELKTPVSTISNLIQVFPLRSSDTNFVKRFVTLTREELNRTQQLIDNLLVYGKDIDTKNEEWIAFEPFIKALSEKCGIRVGACPPFRIYGDRFYLGLLFENLLRNSRGAGSSEVSIGLADPSGQNGSFAEIRFEDNGAGFPEDRELDTLMNPFITGRSSGAGLGLYLVKKIAAVHGGVVTPYRPARGAGIKIMLQKKRVRNA